MGQHQIDMDDLEDRDRDVLRVLADGRANPKLIRDETGLDKGDANTVLVRLGRGGLVRQVTRGLYEITAEGLREVGVTPGEATLEDALDGLQAAERYCEGADLDELSARCAELYQDLGTQAEWGGDDD